MYNFLLQNGLVNFEKRRKEFELLAQLTLYQKSASAYTFPHNPQLVRWIQHSTVLSEQERYIYFFVATLAMRW